MSIREDISKAIEEFFLKAHDCFDIFTYHGVVLPREYGYHETGRGCPRSYNPQRERAIRLTLDLDDKSASVASKFVEYLQVACNNGDWDYKDYSSTRDIEFFHGKITRPGAKKALVRFHSSRPLGDLAQKVLVNAKGKNKGYIMEVVIYLNV